MCGESYRARRDGERMSMTRECALCGTLTRSQNNNLDEAVLCEGCTFVQRRYRQRRKTGRCPFCNMMVKVGDLRDKLSLREFMISGLCQKCQDGVFKSCK